MPGLASASQKVNLTTVKPCQLGVNMAISVQCPSALRSRCQAAKAEATQPRLMAAAAPASVLAPGGISSTVASANDWQDRVAAGPPAFAHAGDAALTRVAAGIDGLEVCRAASGHNSLYATKAFKAGEVITRFEAAETLASPNYLTMQTGPATHIILSPSSLLNINHSCKPNTFWDTQAMQVEALVDISPDTELTFFYCATEWSMETPFDCCCGKAGCLGRIAGAKYLPEEAFGRYRVNWHIIQARAQHS